MHQSTLPALAFKTFTIKNNLAPKVMTDLFPQRETSCIIKKNWRLRPVISQLCSIARKIPQIQTKNVRPFTFWLKYHCKYLCRSVSITFSEASLGHVFLRFTWENDNEIIEKCTQDFPNNSKNIEALMFRNGFLRCIQLQEHVLRKILTYFTPGKRFKLLEVTSSIF